MVSRRIQLERTAITDMAWWLAEDRKVLKRIFDLAQKLPKHHLQALVSRSRFAAITPAIGAGESLVSIV